MEYVSYENNKAFVSIDGSLYSAEDVVAAVDETYQTAFDLATSFVSTMNKLPALANLTAADKEVIDALQNGFNNMTEYQQSFIANKYIEMLQQYVERMAVLTADSEEEGETTEDAEEIAATEEAAATEETVATEEVATTEETAATGEGATTGESV